jgi:restriction endonuclease S subunit
MFETYDDIDRFYELRYEDGTVVNLTAMELYEYYLLHEHGILDSFERLKLRLDGGEEINASHYVYDFSIGGNVYRGKVKFKNFNAIKKNTTTIKQDIPNVICRHENKYVNQAGGIKFWVCPTCKKDLGNA